MAASQNARPVLTLPAGETLRTLLDKKFQRGETMSLDQAIAMVVPLCLDLKTRHDRGERLHLHPSCIVAGPDGLARIEPSLAVFPSNGRDRACVAPENQRTMVAGDSRASVFSIGALLYETLTGSPVGPGMARPKQLIPDLPDQLETLLAKALVGDRNHRPDDLGALASAMHHIAPMKSIPPPMADERKLDHTGEFEVDVRLSMLPQSEIPPRPAAPIDPFAAVAAPKIARPNDPTTKLAALKERLESDPRPRYVVNKDKMDHGPFSAVELLQQITTNAFGDSLILRDEISGQSRPIKDWEEFAPFAEQANIKREIIQEKKAVARTEKAEKRAGIAKGTAIVLVLLGIGGAAAAWWVLFHKSKNDNVEVADDDMPMDQRGLNGGVKGKSRNNGGGGGGGGGGGNFPSGMTYEAAMASNVQEVNIGGGGGAPDLTNSQLEGPLQNAGSFLAACGTPDSMKAEIKVAVKNGRAVGVSVYTQPSDGKISSCIASKVRGLSWPSNAKMDGVTKRY